jgi:hypothetical protein
VHLRRGISFAWALTTTALGSALGACGTEPSDLLPRDYRLAAVDSVRAGTAPCFASSTRYSAGMVVDQGTCDIALRSLRARFDSTGPAPLLIVTARLQVQGGDTTTWEVGYPATVQHGAIQYGVGSAEPIALTSEQLFILPTAGTHAGGVLTLLMPTYSGSGSFSGNGLDYFRASPSVFILTPTGALLGASALSPRYAALSFAGYPPAYCSMPTAGQGSVCRDQSFTLAADAGTWTVEYRSTTTVAGDTVGGASLHAANLTIRQVYSFVQVISPPPGYPPLAFDAVGSLAGATLTLFPRVQFLDGTQLPSPIVMSAR